MNKQTAIKTPEKATYADVLAAPETMVAEVLQGELYLQPRPLLRHSFSLVELWLPEPDAPDEGAEG